MVAPVIAAIASAAAPKAIDAVVEFIDQLADRWFPDPNEREKHKADLLKMAQDGEFRRLELALRQAEIDAGDRASARQREVSTGDIWTPRLLAGFMVLGFFAVLGYLLVYGAPQHGGEALLVLLGGLGTGFTAVLAYYFGSSQGSASKQAALERIAERKP